MIARYTRPEMGRLFADKHKFDTWLKVELAVCEAWAERGVIPKAAFNRIKKKARFRLKRIEEIEAEIHHDVIAFTTAVADYIGDDSAYFHKGLTSMDIVDTSQNLILKQAGQVLEEDLAKLRHVIGDQALRYKRTPMVGRTHGVHAEPTTFGLRLLIYYDELGRHEERLAAAIDGIAVGKLSGAVGNFANIPPSIEEQVLSRLSLRAAPVSNQVVQRDRHAYFISVLAGIGGTLEKIAVHLRTGQRTELGEVQEPFGKSQKGSSAMPHKKNPILLERVTGLARVLRGYALAALENVALWDERDISNSGVERVILPDACILLDYMLAKLTGVVENLVVYEERMRQNIYLTHGLVFSQRVLLRLTEAGLSREQAYELVQRNAMRCWDEGRPLLDLLQHDSDVRGALSAEEISALFTLEPYLAHVDELFARVGLTEKRRRRRRGGAHHKPPAAADTAEDSLPVQNIEERASDWYETVLTTTGWISRTPIEADETLGEADHQKRPARRDFKKAQDKQAREALAQAKGADSKATAKDKDAAAEKPVQNGGGTNDKKKPSRRRRGSRGGRAKKKNSGNQPVFKDGDDDSYVD